MVAPAVHHVASIGEVRSIIKAAEPHVEQEFFLKEDTPLNQAREFCKAVSAAGGYGVLANAEILGGKDEAFRYVNQKIEELRRLANKSDAKLIPLIDSVTRLQQVLQLGGPELPSSFAPQAFRGPSAYVDADEEVPEEDLEDHILQLHSLILDSASPGGPKSGYRSAEALTHREKLEQDALFEFNCDVNTLKRDLLNNFTNDLRQGIQELENKYLVQPTHLGCGSSNFVPFESFPMLPADRKGQTW